MEPSRATWERVLTTNLTRAQIVQYAGASGDFNPIHIDEPYAIVRAGLPSVIAPGMLTLAMTLDAIGRVFGEDSIVTVDARFVNPVFAGDQLVARFESAELEVDSDGPFAVEFSTRRPDQVVLLGSVCIAGSPGENHSKEISDGPPG